MIGSVTIGIEKAKKLLNAHFVTKDMRRPLCFLGVEISHNKQEVTLSQRKYALDLLQEAGLLSYKPVQTLIEADTDCGMNLDLYLRIILSTRD